MDKMYKLINEFVESTKKYNECMKNCENERKKAKKNLKDFLREWATKTKDLKCDLLFCGENENKEEMANYVFFGGYYLRYGDEKIYYKQNISDVQFIVIDDIENSEFFDIDRFLRGFEEYMQEHIKKLAKETKKLHEKLSK